MDGRSTEEVREELEEVMREQIESLQAQTFGGLSEEELREQQERLKRIRELSADYLSAVKKTVASIAGATAARMSSSDALVSRLCMGCFSGMENT